MEKATARRLFDLLQDLGHESTSYSRVKTLRENEVHRLKFNLGKKWRSLGACLISDRTRELWFVITKLKNDNNYNIVILAKNKKQYIAAVIHQEKWTYKPSKRDGEIKNKRRKKKFESIFKSTTVPIPFPKNEGSIRDFLNRVFDVVTIRIWADDLEDESSPELRSFPEREPRDANPESGDASKYDIDSAFQDIFVDREQLERILYSIRRRKNLILQGPPGVGKTFIARRIAWCLIGRKDSNPVEMVC